MAESCKCQDAPCPRVATHDGYCMLAGHIRRADAPLAAFRAHLGDGDVS